MRRLSVAGTPLMLIHGAWLSALSWERFEGYVAERGFAVSTPEWPCWSATRTAA